MNLMFMNRNIRSANLSRVNRLRASVWIDFSVEKDRSTAQADGPTLNGTASRAAFRRRMDRLTYYTYSCQINRNKKRKTKKY